MNKTAAAPAPEFAPNCEETGDSPLYLKAIEERNTARKAAAFFASAVKSGESWTSACDDVMAGVR